MAKAVWSQSPQGADASSFADALPLVRSVLPKALIDDRGWERLTECAKRLPPSAADAAFGFECRLDEPEASADLLVSVLPRTPFADALARNGAAGEAKAASLARFLSEFRRPGTPLAEAVDLVALEFDVARLGGFPTPGFFLRSAAESGYAAAELLTSAVALAAGWREEPAERRGAGRILDALPPGAAIRWAGAFPDRKTRAVRLLVRALSGSNAAFLSRIGWTGNAAAVDGIVSEFRASGVDNNVLALDLVEGRVSSGLGLELSRPGQTGGGWGGALDMMSGKHWCLPDKAVALGLATRSERIFSRAGISEIHCGVNHVKLGVAAHERGAFLSDDRIGSAKGYVVCVLRPLS